MNSRLRWRSLTRAWTWPVSRSMPGQQADRAVALVLVVAREGRLSAGLGRQVRGGRGDCLNAGLLIVGDNRHRIARFLFCGRRRLLDEPHFAIDAQNLGHLLLELRIAAFQVVADLVRLHLLLIEDLAHRALNQLAEAGVSFGGSMLARVASQEPRRPQLVRIAQVLRLATGQRDQDRLMMHPQSTTNRKEREVFPVGQQHPRPLDAARRLRSRAGYRNQLRQILSSDRQLDRSPPRRHDLRTSFRESKITLQTATNQMNPS